MQYSNDLLNDWKSLDRVLPFIQDKWQRPLVIEVFTENDPKLVWVLESMLLGCCDVARTGLQWTSEEGYGLLTRYSLELLAIYIDQAATIDILYNAIREIQCRLLAMYTFACKNAEDGSVACAILLAMIGYPKAEIRLKTPRTKNEALECGLLRAE